VPACMFYILPHTARRKWWSGVGGLGFWWGIVHGSCMPHMTRSMSHDLMRRALQGPRNTRGRTGGMRGTRQQGAGRVGVQEWQACGTHQWVGRWQGEQVGASMWEGEGYMGHVS